MLDFWVLLRELLGYLLWASQKTIIWIKTRILVSPNRSFKVIWLATMPWFITFSDISSFIIKIQIFQLLLSFFCQILRNFPHFFSVSISILLCIRTPIFWFIMLGAPDLHDRSISILVFIDCVVQDRIIICWIFHFLLILHFADEIIWIYFYWVVAWGVWVWICCFTMTYHNLLSLTITFFMHQAFFGFAYDTVFLLLAILSFLCNFGILFTCWSVTELFLVICPILYLVDMINLFSIIHLPGALPFCFSFNIVNLINNRIIMGVIRLSFLSDIRKEETADIFITVAVATLRTYYRLEVPFLNRFDIFILLDFFIAEDIS